MDARRRRRTCPGGALTDKLEDRRPIHFPFHFRVASAAAGGGCDAETAGAWWRGRS